MVRKVFSVFDEKAEAYLPPFIFDTIGLAIRTITDCVNDSQHQFGSHSSDYSLFLIAEFNDATGEYSNCKKPLGSLVEFKNKED